MELNTESPTVIQDTVHILTKMKTRLLNSNINLRIGNHLVSSKIIADMIGQFSKDKHCLCLSDLNSEDKMNFEAAQKLCSERVMKMLQKLPESEGTVQYLNLMQKIEKTFLDKSITCRERVFNIWYAIFFLRIWRHWIYENKLNEKSFITANTYTGIELNGHGLIILINKLQQTPEEFLPWLFSSQPCEKNFRQTRSMTSTFSTIVNFSMLDILRRLSRIQKINEIVSDLGESFSFPRENNNKLGGSLVDLENQARTYLLDMEEIKKTIIEAKQKAADDAIRLGLAVTEEHVYTIHLKESSLNLSKDAENMEINEDSENDIDTDEGTDKAKKIYISEPENIEEDEEKDLNVLENLENLDLKDFSYKNKECDKNSSYLTVTLKNGKEVVVKKSSLCWLFTEKKGRLSTDRLVRVKGMGSESMSKNKALKSKLKRKSKATKSKSASESVSYDDSGSDTDTETEYISDKSESSGGELMIEKDYEEETPWESHKKDVLIEKEKYYSVYYDEQWYIGRILNITDEGCTIKFLERNLDDFVWPKLDDIAEVNRKFIFHGPINLLGSNPFQLKRADVLKIQKIYKNFKSLNIR